MKIDTTKFSTQKELLAHLKSNKAELIAAKKSATKRAEPLFHAVNGSSEVTKAGENSEETDTLAVKVVANASMVLDSDMDVLITGCYDKTIDERKHITPHLHDHISSLDAKIGEVKDIYTEQIAKSDLRLPGSGTTECCLFETDVMKSYNEKIFNQYKANKVNQHSIGLNYIKIDLAINDEDSPEEKAVYDKYIGQIINPKKAIEKGFFWAVEEIMLIENSAVLFGANHATPTLETNPKGTKIESTSALTSSNDFKSEQVQRLRNIQQQIKI